MEILSLAFIGGNFLFLILIGYSVALDFITPSQSMIDGGVTLVSGNGRFELGFFSPGLTTQKRYLGIRYRNSPATAVVWVANRSSPINDSSGVLMIDSTGNLVLVNANNSAVWSTNTTTGAERPVVQLLDSGNLVLRDQEDGNSGNYLWQSFDYPGDTFMPGMKLGWDFKRGLNRRLTSWRSADDPAPGDFTWGTELEGNPELVMRKGAAKFYRSGPWNGMGFSGSPDIKPNPVFDYNFVLNEDEAYYTYAYKNSSAMLRLVMNQTLYSRQRYTWSEETKSWVLYGSVPRDLCDHYATCGAYGNCIIGAGTAPMKKIAVVIPVTAVFIAAILLISYFIWRREANRTGNWGNDQNNDRQKEDLELPLFEFTTVVDATSNFSVEEKLGEGGFGAVYRGTLPDGREVAVKRLSRDSGQGLNEFKNEVILITKLQHRNLVKLIDQAIRKQLDWSKRFNIICGIAKGLLYLHQDSRLRIIHRDLKASNVLLDEAMNPKISDFGLARIFAGDQTEGNTSRVVGTYGYMAPEYATDGLFSVKSDVFSFGILMLEIVSGKKSRGFFHPNHSLSLIGFAWRLWKDEKPLELIDASSSESGSNISEMMRCIHISLLCVQQRPEDRPSMASVVMMLGGESTAMPFPREPGFINDKGPLESDSSWIRLQRSSTNQTTISLLEPR
ncbi:hypothetical protein Tsubulata_033365 [Turnera subulata]|uniref:non-specific serine/threonine protein kinase n=1 Tax=Turnera subulata TaxID=218843 RepID=A0A9Q0J896_9ROSI|nr:hypothetical protein Tsubulata_033365 [Turnera subulata]